MRSIFALLLVLVAAGPAVAGGGLCIPSCEVTSNSAAFVPQATILERGSSVEWSSFDIGHAAADDAGPGPGSVGTCFWTDYTPARPNSAFFTISEGVLLAVSDFGLLECEHARALPDGSFVLDYVCPYHDRMVGTLVIR